MAHPPLVIGRRGLLLGGSAGLLLPAAVRGNDRLGPMVTPEAFGASGEGRDDTLGLQAMVEAVNRAGRGHVRFAAGKTYRLGHHGQRTLHFRDLAGLLIEGRGATLKTADRGCPTASLGFNWGQITIDNCRDVQLLGLTFDGNRSGQTHTAGAPDGTGFNAGLNLWTASDPNRSRDVLVRGCTFRDHGTLTASSDVRGDGIYAMSGVRRLSIEDCRFEDVGRWAFALAEGGTASEQVHFRRNRVVNANRAVARNRPWGAIDIEDGGLANRHITIEDNLFVGTCLVSYGGYSLQAPFEVSVEDTAIRRNRWLIPATGGNAANTPWIIGHGRPGSGTYRTFRRLVIDDNEVIWTGTAQTMHLGLNAKLVDVFMRRNRFTARQPQATSQAGLFLGYGGHLEGRVEISDNAFVGLGEAIANPARWYDDPSPEPLALLIAGNRFDGCFRAFNLQFDGCAAPPATSRIVMRGNRSRDTRSPNGEYLDGGGLRLEVHDRSGRDKVWAHRNVDYR